VPGARGSRRLAAALPPLLIGSLALLAAELYLRIDRFGAAALRRPLWTMAPDWHRPDCVRTGPGGELMTPHCRMPHKGVLIDTNSAGLNDHEVDESAPHFRVLVLGDSFSMADGVAQPDLYHTLVEESWNRELGAPGFVELYNHARGGRTQARELADLESALRRWKLDAVLVGVAGSDYWENVQERESCSPEHERLLLDPEERRLYDRHVRGRNPFTRAISAVETATGLWVVNRLRDLGRALVVAVNDDPATAERVRGFEGRAVAAFRACVRRIREVADSAGVELAWVVLANPPDPHAGILLRELTGLGEPALGTADVGDGFTDPAQQNIYRGDRHPSAAVHRAYAQRIRPWLDRIGWVERSRAAWAARRAG
jgi:hypothetical protein